MARTGPLPTRLADRRRVLTDAGALALLSVVLFWLPLANGGRTRGAGAVVALLAVAAAPAVVAGARLASQRERVLLGVLGLVLVVHPLLGGYRDGLIEPLLRYATAPLVYLSARYVAAAWPRLLTPAVLLSGVWLWLQAVPGWLSPPDEVFAAWRVVPWHNPAGALSGAMGVFALTLAVRRGGRWWHVAASALGLSACWLSGSRASIALTACMLVVIVVSHVRSRGGVVRLGTILAASLVLSGGLLLVSPAYGGDGPVVIETGTTTETGIVSPLGARSDSGGTLAARRLHLDAAWRLFRSHPWLGTGLGSYGYAILDAADPAMNFTRSVHNEPLEVLAEGGLFVGGPFGVLHVALLAVLVPPILVRRRAGAEQAAAATAAALLLVHATLDIDWAFLLIPTLVAVLAGLARSGSSPEDGVTQASPGRGAAVVAALLLAPTVLGFALVVDVTLADRADRVPTWHAAPHVAAAVDALAAGDLVAASDAAADAARSAPRDDAVSSLTRVVDLAGTGDAEALVGLVATPGGSVRTATYALAALVGTGDPQAAVAAERLLARLDGYEPGRLAEVLPLVEALRDRAQLNSAR